MYKQLTNVLLLLGSIRAQEDFLPHNHELVLTDLETWMKCDKDGDIACISDDLQHSYCCAFQFQPMMLMQCMQSYRYCTYGLESNNYKYLTCPASAGCPEPMTHVHTAFDEVQVISRTVDSPENRCKLRIEADSKLNGKIVMKVNNLGPNTALDVYVMPARVARAASTHGLLENGNYQLNLQEDAVISAPADWQIIVNFYRLEGSFKVSTWVQEFESTDVNRLRNQWQPTNTSYAESEYLELRDELNRTREKQVAEEQELDYLRVSLHETNNLLIEIKKEMGHIASAAEILAYASFSVLSSFAISRI